MIGMPRAPRPIRRDAEHRREEHDPIEGVHA
jgi:hypothetical protein